MLPLEELFALAAPAEALHSSAAAPPHDLGVTFLNVAKESGLNAKTIFGGEHKRSPKSWLTLKKVASSDTVNLEFRAEALNIFNHPNYGPIDNNPDSSTFGGVQGKTGNRIMQLGLRLFF